MQKLKQISRGEVLNIDLPEKTETYSPISNQLIIENVIKSCNILDYSLLKEEYEITSRGQQIKMKFFLQPEGRKNGFQICVLNSYDKSISARMAGGIYAHICWNLNYVGEITGYRKHTGDAPEDVQKFIIQAFDQQERKFQNAQLMEDAMLYIPLTLKEQAELAGQMLISEELISINQLSLIHKELKKPSFDYDFDISTLWGTYNAVTHSIKGEHPTSYLQTQQGVQSFFVDTYEQMTGNKLELV